MLYIQIFYYIIWFEKTLQIEKMFLKLNLQISNIATIDKETVYICKKSIKEISIESYIYVYI